MSLQKFPVDADLQISAGRVVCPLSGWDGPGAVAIRGDRIVAVGPEACEAGVKTLAFPDAILLPGLIDLHTHPARSGSQFGVDPDRHLLARGTTTVLSQGDVGADEIEEYVLNTIQTSQTDIRLAINLSVRGEAGPGGCFEQLEWADVAACVAAVKRHRQDIWGIAVNVSHHSCGRTDPQEVFRRGIQAAEQTGLPLISGLRRPEDWPLSDQLRQLRPGDVVTYCFRRSPYCFVQQGRVIDAVREARERGVLFDVGHGCGSWDFETAEAAISEGVLPDTISTDLQRGHLGQIPVHDLPLVMSKLKVAGMPEREIFRAVTIRPAEVLGLSSEIGSLQVGTRADLVVLRWKDSGARLVDVQGNYRTGGQWVTAATVRRGKLVTKPAP